MSAKPVPPPATAMCSETLTGWYSADLGTLAAYIPATEENHKLLITLDAQLERIALTEEKTEDAVHDAVIETVERVAGEVEGLYWRREVCGLPAPTHDEVSSVLSAAIDAA